MTLFRRRTLKAIFTLILFPLSHCFAAVRYVNINNTTPGAGTSWATAYNDLQSALAAANIFDQIWIAQGTYKPSVPAGRSATFLIPNDVFIYGGFIGTETAVTDANPSLYPTILSGDIGVAGNASDNCYHVLTSAVSYSECHGVTIRDGQADAGSSSLAQADNTGGGVLFLAVNSGDIADTYFYNCTFTNNYAFFGGAMGSYCTGAIEVNYNATNCFFHDNQAVYGGAIYNTNVATGYLYNFQNDIFYNNTASSGASVFGNNVTNNNSTEFFHMENSLFYNEAAPIFTNDLTNSASSSPEIDYNVLWTTGTPYTLAYSGGNTPFAMTNSDINGSFPVGSNIDADPLFVNPAGYDFHVSPCSPVIDQGATFAEYPTDIGGSARFQGPKIDIGPYETLKGTAGTAPTVNTPVPFCLNSTASDLSTDATGTSLLWYTAATGGTGSSTAPTPATTATGTTRYYVTQTPSGSCESNRQEIDVNINSLPANPTFTPPSSYCLNSSASALSASGTSLLWYTTAAGGTGNPATPTPVTTSAGATDYYVTQTVGGCESPRTDVTVTVKPTPADPTYTAPLPYCLNASANVLAANGAGLLWYAAATGGTGSPMAPTPTTAAAGTTTYYVTQTVNGCESQRASINVTVGSPSADPTPNATPQYCANTTANALTANGVNLLWYTTATGGTANATAPTPSTTIPGTTAYYVTQTPAGSCESSRLEIDVTVNATPQISIDPVNASPCAGGAVNLQANGADSYEWSPATGLSNPEISDPVATIQSNILYTVTGTTNGCPATAQITLTLGTACEPPTGPPTGPPTAPPTGPAANTGYYIPNAFRPNGDGANDLFRVKTSDAPKSFSMIIFNRYGGKVFETADVNAGWNGTIGGNIASSGTYIYTVTLTTSTGSVIKKQGTVILVR